MSVAFDIDVILDESIEVKGHIGSATMILFHGECRTDFFTGKILPGAVDTQSGLAGKPWMLSARYILEGRDSSGHNCRIFVENNGTVMLGGEICTKPRFFTDSAELAWLEDADFEGAVIPTEKGVKIHFRQNNSVNECKP